MTFARHTKYGNVATCCRQGNPHASKLEARRCDELHLLQLAHEIRDLVAHPQPVYRLEVNGRLIARYIGDFEYLDRNGNRITEDTKGVRTDVFRLKAELFRAIYGREIVEVRRVRAR